MSHSGRYGLAAFVAVLASMALLGAGRGAPGALLPHGFCYQWQPNLIRLHLVSDMLIGLAYIAIPLALVHFIRRRADLPFNWMFILFGVFIVACGATHWMEIWTLWYPDYWASGAVKALTAAASVPTAILLFMLIPQALAIPSTAQLREAKAALEEALGEHEAAQRDLQAARDELERRVRERTRELQEANAQLERQRAELLRSDRAKSEFLAILSHELRNPIHAIGASARVLSLSASDDPGVQRATAAIDRQIGRLGKLLEDLLDVIGLRQGHRMELEDADLRSVLSDALAGVGPDVEARGQPLSIQAPEGRIVVRADSARLAQVLSNLLDNASKFSPPGSPIGVEVTTEGAEAVVRVKDEGAGIPPEELEEIFRLFTQGSDARDRAIGGLGIGLHVSREIAEAHGGRLEAHSPGPGLGATFVLRLPLAARAD